MGGQTISHYKIIDKLGQGGTGKVFLAKDTSLEREVALKFRLDSQQDDPTAPKRFLQEAKSAAALDHPFICHVHEVGEDSGKTFISMEYVQGLTDTCVQLVAWRYPPSLFASKHLANVRQ